MTTQGLVRIRLRSQPTLVRYQDDASFVAFRYEKTVQAEPPISILTPPWFRSSVPARDTTVNDSKGGSGLGAAASASATAVKEEWCKDQVVAFDKVTARPRVGAGSFSSTLSVDSRIELRAQSLSDLSPAAAPNLTPTRGSFTTSDKSFNLAPVIIPDNLNLLSKDVADFSPISISIPTVSLLDDDFLTTLSFSNRGSLMFGGRRAFSTQTTDGTMEHERQTDHTRPPSPALAPIPEPPAARIQYDNPTPPSFPSSTNNQSILKPASDGADATIAKPTSYELSSTRTTATEASPPEQPVEAHIADGSNQELRAESIAQSTSLSVMATPSIRVLSADVELESRKVRSLYEPGDSINWEDGARPSDVGERLESTPQSSMHATENDAVAGPQPSAWDAPKCGSCHTQRPDVRTEYELAGGLEDWEDINGYDVDRYGFINPRKAELKMATSTDLKTSQYASRRRNVLLKRDVFGLGLPVRGPSRKVSARSLNTQGSKASVASRRSTRSAIRQAGNYLPHNRDRRWMDEAGEMLSLSLGEEEKIEKISEAIKRKEWERSEKWRKMAKVIRKGNGGEGMEFEFDVKNQKLIDRTWKGIPDRWRASAWYSFMTSSARAHKDSPSDDSIITDFRRLQARGSPDDVQIDLDVPRTISRHVMFRKRYRGGQRLLFRVLHALSLYFPNTGYVQGMASLAATLLCYFDEEKCFVMLVRMWQLRGLEKLYSPGFDGLMAALNDLQTTWLDGKDAAKKLTDLCIDPTAYGTRWYLTLFNLSIPFAAQLRVWDVFLLLGDSCSDTPAAKPSDFPATMTGIDILHATSAALIHALREVLMDSDFENAMKALTSWIPVKDEDILMKVTRAEWKSRLKKRS
ncbi:tbc domain protein [Colletotrichum musicola]|uniref:Tbc domain protein n=1 Tax=Colletotrichum musicola TaxID=2175873 RepID=A0A8H6IUS1_9PEZI|nr:tbc domain protein [Colletotrichum musicola]